MIHRYSAYQSELSHDPSFSGYDIFRDTEAKPDGIVLHGKKLSVERVDDVGQHVYDPCECYPNCTDTVHRHRPRGGYLPVDRNPKNSSYMADYMGKFI